MERFFDRLTDIALQRVYKFVIKQTIGQFLEDDLLLNQLHVNTRDGFVRIHDLNLNVDALNQRLQGLPIAVVRASLNNVEIQVSYSKILSESCSIKLDEVFIELAFKTPDKTSTELQPDDVSANEGNESIDDVDVEQEISSEGEEGLSFIAQWIELVISKLRFSINTIKLLWKYDDKQILLSLNGLRVKSIHEVFESQLSLNVSQSAITSADVAQSILSSPKTIIFDALTMSFSLESSWVNLLQITEPSTVRVKGAPDSLSGVLSGVDIDINMGDVLINVSIGSMHLLLELLISLMNDLDSESTLEAFDHLRSSLGETETNALNLSIMNALRKLKEKRANAAPPTFAIPNSSLVDSGDEYISEDDDASEFEFHDAINIDDIADGMNKSSLGKSVLGLNSTVFASALYGTSTNATDSVVVGGFFRLRASVSKIACGLQRGDDVFLKVILEDIVLTMAQAEESNPSRPSELPLKSTVSVRNFTVVEEHPNHRNHLLLFSDEYRAHSIFSVPDIEITYVSNASSQRSSINISLRPFFLSLDFCSVDAWSSSFAQLQGLPSTSRDSAGALNLTVSIPRAGVLLRGDPTIGDHAWNDIDHSLRLDIDAFRWFVLLQREERRKDLLNDSRGGLFLDFERISVNVDSDNSRNSIKAVLKQGSFNIFVRTRNETLATVIAIAGGPDVEDGVCVQLDSAPSKERNFQPSQRPDSGIIDDLGPVAPDTTGCLTVDIHAQELKLDLQQREFNALVFVADKLVSDSGQSTNITEHEERALFKMHISADRALLSLGETAAFWATSKNNRHLASRVGKGDIFVDLLNIWTGLPFALKTQEDLLKLTVAIRNPSIDFIQGQREVFVSLRANDFSIFELTPQKFERLNSEKFDYFALPRLQSRGGHEHWRIPIVHRAYVREGTQTSKPLFGVSLADHLSYGSAFEVRLLMSSSSVGVEAESVKNLNFFIDVYDILINHDPTSTWLLKLVAILSPMTTAQFQIYLVNSAIGMVRKALESVETANAEFEQILLNANSWVEERAKSIAVTRTEDGLLQIPFETTRMTVRVRESLIDYFSVVNNSSILLSVDTLTMASTIVSNTETFVLRLSLSSLSFYQSRTPLHPPVSEENSDWKSSLGYSSVVTLDELITVVTIADSRGKEVALEFQLGSALVRGSIDDLILFANNLQGWLKGFESACIQSEPVVHGATLGEKITIVQEQKLDKFRYCSTPDELPTELISSALIDGEDYVPAVSQDLEAAGSGFLTEHGLDSNIVQDYFGDFSENLDENNWIADYEYDNQDDLSDHINVTDVAQGKNLIGNSTSKDSQDDEQNSFGVKSLFLFPRNDPGNTDVELKAIDIPNELLKAQIEGAVEPGLTTEELSELRDLEKVWDSKLATTLTEEPDEQQTEESARWMKEFSQSQVDHQYVTPSMDQWTDDDDRPEIEKKMGTDIIVRLRGTFRFQIYDSQLSSTTANEQAFIEVCASNLRVQIYSYIPRLQVSTIVESQLLKRIDVRINDILVVFHDNKHRSKVIGTWKTHKKPRDETQSVFHAVLLLYNGNNRDECRARVALQPLRVYLSERLINFLRSSLAVRQNADPSKVDSPVTEETEHGLYFQALLVEEMSIKIDYKASHVNLTALQGGDVLQLLNIFPIDGLEITLKRARLNGVPLAEAVRQVGEQWVQDIYKNQLHKVIAGAAPLKGIVHIGEEVQELIFATKLDPSKRSTPARHLQRGASNLATTIAKEALDVTHRFTKFVADTITDVASEEPKAESSNRAYKQPKGFQEGLRFAVDSLSREVTGAAQTVLAVPIRQNQRRGNAVTSVVRALPVAVLRPIAGVAEGLSYTVLGLRNQLDPHAKAEEEDYWDINF